MPLGIRQRVVSMPAGTPRRGALANDARDPVVSVCSTTGNWLGNLWVP